MRQFGKIDLAAAHRPLANAEEQQASFQSQLREVEEEISRVDTESVKGHRRSLLDDEAERLLAGKAPAPIDLEALTSEHNAFVRRRSVLSRTVELVKRCVLKETSAASRIVCKSLEPEHRAIVGGIAKALINLGRVLEVERSFRENLNDSGVKFIGYLRPMPVPGLGLVTDANGRLTAWFKDAIQSGLIDEGDIPADWRKKWSVESWRRPEVA